MKGKKHRKDRKRRTSEQQQVVVGSAWYRSDQWDHLREVSEDRDDLEETWEEWADSAEESLRDLRAAGIKIAKVDVDVEELIRWCNSKHQPINAESRSAFAAERLQLRNNT